jgi:quinolinate synthase
MNDLPTGIEKIRRELGENLFVLGHHYQRGSVLRHVDATGDSLELSRKAGANAAAEKIVFCGVKFMAESADILSSDDQTVYMPEMNAGCPMANMAKVSDMQGACKRLEAVVSGWLPVVYVNSSAEVKGCCGELGGATCTSSNARKVFEWAFSQGKRILFLPDEHLAWNTATDLGIPDDEVAVYDPLAEGGGLTDEQIQKSKVVAWKGFCIVHQAFTEDQISQVREMRPDAKIIIHPEAPKEVVRLCDAHGSTAQIIDYVEKAAEGSCIVIGTEVNLVERLAEKHRGRVEVKALKASVCANMARTNEANLLAVLSDWPEANIVSVDKDVRDNSRIALERMLAI